MGTFSFSCKLIIIREIMRWNLRFLAESGTASVKYLKLRVSKTSKNFEGNQENKLRVFNVVQRGKKRKNRPDNGDEKLRKKQERARENSRTNL